VPLLLPDVSSHPKYVSGNPDIRSELAVPVLAGDEFLGVLNVESRQPAAFGGDELAILQAVAGQLAVALQNLEARRQLRELAIRDPLTDLYNRRFLNEVIGQEVAAARRYRRPLALLYVDVDGFRAVNNTRGHQVGDLVLRRVAKYLQENVREADYVFRIGGDEFLILLPETDGEAEGVAKRLKQGIREAMSDVGVPIGLSIGIAVWGPDEEFDLDTLIALADKRMYEDKQRRISD
jgi:diguanylate cyclase (GGDEF)-like protein